MRPQFLTLLAALPLVVADLTPRRHSARAVAHRAFGEHKCGHHLNFVGISAEEMLRNTTDRLAEQAKVARATTSKTISVYWHTIVSENKEGAITPDQISQQMDTVNKDFADSGITFKLVASDTTVNSDWFSKMVQYFTPEETEMKIALHKGGPGDLNVYTAQLTGYFGYTTVPEAYASQPKNGTSRPSK
ncbi:hypothetical protein OC845_002118 [Tilletia horrida]|nr:hypothetical protein OC845_002118 [Tilletia horrida]